MRNLAVLFFCFVLSSAAFAQKNYKKAVIFKASGDSVICFVNDREWLQNPSVISVKTIEGGQITSFNITDIKSINIENGDRYQAALVKVDITQTEFLTPYLDPQLVKSEEALVLLLLEYAGNPFKLFSLRKNNRLHLYLQKKQDTPEELIYRKVTLTKDGIHYETEDKAFVKQLDEFITGCEKAERKTTNASYSVNDISGVLQAYDVQCGGNNTQYVNRSNEKNKWGIAIIAGISVNKAIFTSSNGQTTHPLISKNSLQSDPSFSAGTRILYTIPRLHKKLSVLADICYNSFTATVTENSSYVSNDLYTKKTLTLNPAVIRTGLLARYRFLKGPFLPFVQAGFGAALTLSHKESAVYDDYYNGQSHITSQDPYAGIDYKKMQLGFVIGAGIEYKRLSLDYKYEPTTGSVNVSTLSSSVKTSTILIGFRLTK